MKLLLDTHFVIWWLSNSPRLSRQTRLLIAETDCAVSAVSLIEIRLKVAARKLAPPPGASAARQIITEGFASLPLTPEHVEESARFEYSHPDIYDRLLLGTATIEGRTLLTCDAALLALAKTAQLGFVVEG